MTLSTNALIAILRAVTHEIDRAEALLAAGDSSEEMGLYVNDLHEALAGLSTVYSAHQQADDSLTPVDRLLKYFSEEDWPPQQTQEG